MNERIQRIMCCCGNGVGTSLIMQMTIEEALELLERTDIEVIFGAVSEISEDKADLFVVASDFLGSTEGLPAIGLEDLMDAELAAELLKPWLEERG